MKEKEKNTFSELKIEELLMDNGVSCEVFLPDNPRDRILYANEYCEFKPVGYAKFDFGWMPLAYKVVTDNLKSLGLRKNPNPLFFPIGEWVYEENLLQHGNEDYGGIWSAYRLGNANTLAKYCFDERNIKTRIFLTAVYNPVAFVGNYRIKSEGVMLMKEVF